MRFKFNFTLKLVVTLIVNLLFGCGNAAQMEDLYSARIPVDSKVQEVQNLAIVQGLSQVLERVSGKAEILADDSIKAALITASSLVEQYTYQNLTPAEYIIIDENKHAKLLLVIKYSAKLVDDLVVRAGFKIWGSNRPVTLMWLVAGDDYTRKIINEDSDPEVALFIGNLAKTKGLPIIFPLLDLEDVQKVSITDLWGQFTSPLKAYSARYGSDAIVAIKMHCSVLNEWSSSWVLLVGDKSFTWQVNAKNKEQNLIQGFARLIDELSAAYSSMSYKKVDTVFLAVENVKNFYDYANVLNYLSTLDAISSVEVVNCSLTNLVFKLITASDLSMVKQNIALDYVLTKLDKSAEELKIQGVDLVYTNNNQEKL